MYAPVELDGHFCIPYSLTSGHDWPPITSNLFTPPSLFVPYGISVGKRRVIPHTAWAVDRRADRWRRYVSTASRIAAGSDSAEWPDGPLLARWCRQRTRS